MVKVKRVFTGAAYMRERWPAGSLDSIRTGRFVFCELPAPAV
jgi:hypothetical protein